MEQTAEAAKSRDRENAQVTKKKVPYTVGPRGQARVDREIAEAVHLGLHIWGRFTRTLCSPSCGVERSASRLIVF